MFGRYGGLFIPDQRQRGGEKGDLPHSKDRTNHCRDKVGICLLTYTKHSIQTWLTQESRDSLSLALIHQWLSLAELFCSSNLQSLT